jgi:very-short-patch-repair endonuclease
MRREMTTAEGFLWEALRDRRLHGFRFRAQHPVGRFILDFYCAACKLAVELDGAVHDTRREEDAARTQLLEAHGIAVVRFRNVEVLQDLAGVLNRIREACQARAAERAPSGPPRIGG